MTAASGVGPAAGAGGDRDHALVLLGATGFTGRLTAHHLAARLAGSGTRWAIAGRSRPRLEALREELGGEPAIEVVDAADLAGLVDLAGRTRALATTVGPYARHGELVVQACVRTGTHYADITGEPAFTELVRARYDADARRRGVAVVPSCGFESVPADLGAQLTAAHLPDDAPADVRGYVRATGRLSGGTAQTALEAVAARRLPRRRAAVGSEAARPVAPLPPRPHRVPELGAWGVPVPTVDAEVVLRSAAAGDGYGTAFRYGHHVAVRRLAVAAAGAVGLGAFAAAAAVPPTRALLRRVLPASGQGPSATVRARSRFVVTFVGSGGGRRVVTRVSDGDPGYEATAVMLGEALRALGGDGGEGPRAAGVTTPALALGPAYRERLAEAGIAFEVLASG